VLKRFPQATQTFVLGELRELERLGTRVAVVARGGPSGGAAVAPHRLAGPVHHLPDPAGPAEVARVVTALRPAHLHAHFAGWAAAVAARAARDARVGFSFTAHATDIYRDGLDESRLADLLAAARFVVTVTEANRLRLEQVLAAHGRRGQVLRLYNGVDLRRLALDERPRARRLVVSVGRLVEKKGHGVLIEAVRRMRRSGQEVRCVIVGEGPLAGPLRKQVAAAGLADAVELVGPRDHATVLDLLRRASVVALASVVAADGDRDALPTVLLEAMAVGTPVVSTTVCGIPEIVTHGDSGLLVPPGDADALAGTLGRLLADPALRARLAAGGRRRVEERFDGARNAARLAGLFAAAAAQPVGPARPGRRAQPAGPGRG
jgi:glycosyltransferase involved in cell wall biosynthesis